jgi:hypothetical protein
LVGYEVLYAALQPLYRGNFSVFFGRILTTWWRRIFRRFVRRRILELRRRIPFFRRRGRQQFVRRRTQFGRIRISHLRFSRLQRLGIARKRWLWFDLQGRYALRFGRRRYIVASGGRYAAFRQYSRRRYAGSQR